MKLKARNYPYPILNKNSDDYRNSDFNVSATCEVQGSEVILNFNTTLINDDLSYLVDIGDAIVVYHIECPKSAYRVVEQHDNLQHELQVSIDLDQINGQLEVCSFLIARNDLINYTNSDLDEDYSDPIPLIESGCPLAVGRDYAWKIEKTKNELLQSESIFKFTPLDNTKENTINVDYNNDQFIEIYINNKNFADISSLSTNSNLKNVLLTTLILPALIEVYAHLIFIKDSLENSTTAETVWYKTIKAQLEESYKKDIHSILDSHSPLELAQESLNRPIGKAVHNLVSSQEFIQ